MAKVKPNMLIESISGSPCGTSNIYFTTNKQTGKVYAAKLCNPYTGEPTEKQTKQRSAFAAKSKLVSAWMKANKPSTTNPDGTEEYQAVETAYKSQHTIGNIMTYVRTKMDASGNLTIGTGSTASGSTDSGSSSSGSSSGDDNADLDM